MIYLFLDALGLCSCSLASSGSSEQGLLPSVVLGLFLLQSAGSRCRGSVVVTPGLAAARHVGSSPARDRTRVSCIGRWTLHHQDHQGSMRASSFSALMVLHDLDRPQFTFPFTHGRGSWLLPSLGSYGFWVYFDGRVNRIS